MTHEDKFYLTFAYPTTSGALHIGHARSYAIPDVIARYERMKGKDVFFPIGFHATGIDAIRIFEKISEDPNVAKTYGIPSNIVKGIMSPKELVNTFKDIYINSFKDFGLSLNYETQVTTIDEAYKKFVQWHFRKLKEKGYLVQRNYRLPWCPNDNHPVSLDSAEADVSEWKGARIKEYVLIKFGDDLKFPAATLRPETIYGVTNLWVNPDAEYVEALVNNQKQIVSRQAIHKLRSLNKKIEIVKEHRGQEFIGSEVMHPLTQEKLPIYNAKFVDPNEATGIVMSVPAHDPLDFLAYRQLNPSLQIPKVIEIDGESGIPAENLLKKHSVTNLDDQRLENLVKNLYEKENLRGRVSLSIPEIGNKKVTEARSHVIKRLNELGLSDRMYEFSSKPIYCRCGSEIEIRAVEGQWFIDYGNNEWKQRVKNHVANMRTYPPEYKQELVSIVDWLDARPCVRRKGLGTPLPFDESWTIEALSDSTTYMAFYVVSKYLNNGAIRAEQLNDQFFDYVYLGQGDESEISRLQGIPEDVLTKVRDEFNHWYPLDLNAGGKEHKSVHFPFFIFNHVAVFPQQYWPRGVFLNWHLVSYGQKMSKHLGNVIYWDEAVKKFGVDALRLYLTHGVHQWDDFDWKDETAETYKSHIEKFRKRIEKNLSHQESHPSVLIDQWLNSVLNSRIQEATNLMERYEIRKAADVVFFQMNNDLEWYERRGGGNTQLLSKFIQDQLKMLFPFVPYFSQELISKINDGALQDGWPSQDKKLINKKAELLEQGVKKIIEDIQHITSLVGSKEKGYIYVAKTEEEEILSDARDLIKVATGLKDVSVYKFDDDSRYDPDARAKNAKFMRPSIFLE